MFWQLTTYTNYAVDQPVAVEVGGYVLDPILAIIILIFILLSGGVAFLFLLRYFLRRESYLAISFKKVILRVTVPKESSAKHVEDRPTTTEDIRSQIASMEAFFNSIGGLKAKRGLKNWLQGRDDTIGFEIVAQNGTIIFYVAVPYYLQQYVEQQLLAQFFEANIEEVEDYNIFTPTSQVAGAVLYLGRHSMFPIKTYLKMEVDPLNALTNVLSKVEPDAGVLIQVLVRSAHKRWHRAGRKVASEMQQGKKLDEAMSAAGVGFGSFFHSFFKEIYKTFLTQAPKDKNTLEKPTTHQLSPMETEIIKGLEEKTSKAGLDINIRIVVSAKTEEQAEINLKNISEAFNQYNIYQYGNSFKKYQPQNSKRIVFDSIHRIFTERKKFVLNCEELAGIYHLPLPTTETPNILWLTAKKASAPVNVPKEGIVLGKNVYRGQTTLIKIKENDRRRHMYVIGKSGTGKSFFLANLARQDVLNGKGLCIIDPHGDLVDDVLAAIPKERAEDVIIFNPADMERPMGLNLVEYDSRYPEQKTFVINEMIKIFDKLYDLRQTGGPMFEQYMRNALLLILDDPNDKATLMEVSKVLADANFRREKLVKCQNQVVKDFWSKEAEKAGGEASLANMVPYITSKLTQFVSNDIMRPIIGQSASAFNFRQAMDEKKIILVKLSKGQIGEMNAYLLGMVIVGKILMAALSRTDVTQEERKDFYLYIDEFQNFTTDSISIILSEARKYKLNLIIAHQYVGQLVKGQDTSIKDSVFGNAGTLISFKVGADDAEFLAKEFAPVFDAYDLINVEKYSAYVKLLIDNEAARAFNMSCFPLEPGNPELVKKIISLCRLKYGRDRKIVEAEILERIRGFGAMGGGSTDMNFK